MRVFERLRERSRHAALEPAAPDAFESEAVQPRVPGCGRPASPAPTAQAS
jgi:hypothetical protein